MQESAVVDQQNKSIGFTLIEMVIGIVAFSVVLTIIIGVLSPQATRSVTPIMNVRASELAQSLYNEISAKAFDENSGRAGSIVRCNEDLDGDSAFDGPGEMACSNVMGPDAGEAGDKELFDDVDDYHGFSAIVNSFSDVVSQDGRDLYAGFGVSITVFYDGDFDGDDDLLEDPNAIGRHKLVTINVTTPLGQTFVYSTYRSNY